MKKKDEVIFKYKSIFGQEKEYIEILQECHSKMIEYKDKTFTLLDFKDDSAYKQNMDLINSFRKYSTMDDFLLGRTDYSLIPLEQKENFTQKITYHDIMESIELFNESFDKMESFYIPKDSNNVKPTLEFKKALTVNDIFNYINNNQFTVYFIESAKTYCFGAILDGYEYIHYLPFKEIDFNNFDMAHNQNSIIYGYLYLIQEYLINHSKEIKKDKVFTTIYKEYGIPYEEYLRTPKSKNTYVVYNNNLRPFLIEPEGLNYYPRMNQLRFDVVDLLADKKEQHKDFYQYFKGLQFDKNKAEEYVRKNWIVNYDIGRIYGIKYNFVGTKEEVEEYKESIVQRKLEDIELNFHMYKKHGLIKFNQEDVKGFLKEGYTSYLKEYLSSFESKIKDFNTENDNRINLDNSPIFRIGKKEMGYFKYSTNPFKHANIIMNDLEVFDAGKKSVEIQVNLEEFIHSYNEYKQSTILEVNYDWYFPFKQLHDYVENTVQSFCHIRLTSGVRPEEFKVLKDIFFYEGEDRKKILDHPDFIYDTKKYTLQSRNPYYFEIPVILNMYMDVKEFEKIQKGLHSIFKSPTAEKLYQEENIKFLESERFLSKKEIVANSDYDVVYTGFTNKSSNLHKGIKAKIISVDNGFTIQDELGNIHEESFRSVGKSGWKHLSTVNYNHLFDKLRLEEKAFLDNQKTKLIDKP